MGFGGFDVDTELFTCLVEARLMLWGKTNDGYRERKDRKGAWR